MSDQRIRELERRWIESGDPADLVELLRVRSQTGLPVELLAHLGHEGACALLEREPAPLQSERAFLEWVAGLEEWGREVLLRALAALLGLAHQQFRVQQEWFGSEALKLAEAVLSQGGEHRVRALARQADLREAQAIYDNNSRLNVHWGISLQDVPLDERERFHAVAGLCGLGGNDLLELCCSRNANPKGERKVASDGLSAFALSRHPELFEATLPRSTRRVSALPRAAAKRLLRDARAGILARLEPWLLGEEAADPLALPEFRCYDLRKRFEVGEVIRHPKFGFGTVQAQRSKQIEVEFDEGGRRTLAHDR